MGKNPEGHNPRWWRKHPDVNRSTGTVQTSIPKTEDGSFMILYSYLAGLLKKLRSAMLAWSHEFWKKLPVKKNDIVSLVGLLLGLGSWGYSVLSPEPQLWFGMLLLSGAFVCLAVLLIHIFNFRWKGGVIVLILVGGVFWVYTRGIIVAPAYKRELLTLLREGYGLRDECGSRQYYDEAPRYIGDSEERWMARAQTTLEQTRKVDDLQLWEQSELVGLVSDSNIIGFRCTRMAIKTAALETIISRHYDPTIKPNPYNGPVYILDPQHGAKIKLPNGGTMELHVSK
jgi:hypothetical protein